MTETQPPNLEEAVESGSWERVEELWLELLEAEPIPLEALLETRRRLYEEGQKQLARTLLELLAESLEARGDGPAALEALRELVRLSEKPGPELLARLERAVAAARPAAPSLAGVLAKHPIASARRPLDVLADLQAWLDHDVGTVVEVVGQGVGRVVDVNLELGHVKVDVGDRKPVTVPFGAFSKYLRPLPEGDFRRLKVEQPEVLAARAAQTPGDILAELLDSLGEPADVATIRIALDGVVPPEQWSTWWTRARKHPRIVTTGAGSRLRYAVTRSADSATETMLAELEDADPRGRLTVARRIAARGEAAAEATARFLAGSLPDLERTSAGLAWETACLIADLPGGAEPAAAAHRRLLESTSPYRLLSDIGERSFRVEALEALRRERPHDWPLVWGEWLLHEEHPAVLSRLASTLDREGHGDVLDGALEALFRAHTERPAAFVWACEAMAESDAPEALRRRLTPSLLEKIPDTLTKAEFAPLRARAKALLDGGQIAVRLLLEQATPQQATRFSSRISRLDVVEPDRQRLVERAAQQRQSADTAASEQPLLVATKEAVAAKRAELKQLLEVDIPKTLKGINAAAAEGDLRENFEYHMLRDRQELQSARAAKLQRELAEVRILEPGAADASRVNIGTVVRFEGDRPAPLTILGQWDADPAARVFANGAEIAQKLLGRQVGDTVQVEGVETTVAAIEPWRG